MNLNIKIHNTAFTRTAGHCKYIRPGVICESPIRFSPFPYQERHLQCLWADARHRPKELKTTDGESVHVEHPGDWNLEAGPDFRNAILRIGKGKRRICGDLEIHIHANGWYQHGHAGDPRYDQVRFHIVYFQGEEIPGLIQIPLQEQLAANSRFSFENIDPAAYPYSIPSGDFPLKSLHPDKKIELIENAGVERLRLKAERLVLAMQAKEPSQVLWEELMAALGYKNNKPVFRRLATLLPLARVHALTSHPADAYALLLGLSGLLARSPDPAWPTATRKFIRVIWDGWWKQSDEIKELSLLRSEWNLAGIRPANHPIRRLMAAAHYAFRIPDLISDYTLLRDFPDTFWTTHISWKKSCKPTALVGQSRANAMITNILIPYRAANGETNLNLNQLPAEPMNSIVRQTAYALFGPDHTPKIYCTALARQGLIQIFHDYVITHRLNDLKEKVL